MSRRVDHIRGHTYHGRKGAVANAFRYSVDYVLLDMEGDQPPAPRLFSRNRANLTSVQDSDHGGAPKQGTGAVWVRQVLGAHGMSQAGARIALLTQPRVLGHVFNPVSFWLCHDAQDRLLVVVAEVSNTFGERHSYLCHTPDLEPVSRDQIIVAQKIFHVSPFQPVAGIYRFRFDIRADRIGIWIDFSTADGGGVLATLTGSRRPLRNRDILWACLRRPFGSRRVLALIHWQALRLWWKGAGYRSPPAPPQSEVS